MIPAWIAGYSRTWLGDDLAAGAMVAFLALPQSLAYALLAGLPPQAGLYVSILPAIAYAWLGSSMVQAVGPVAVTAIMTFSVLQPLAPLASPEYIEMAACLALMSGLVLCAGGLMRIGFLSQLLSRPVAQGFISGSALLIIGSQLVHVMGVADHSNKGLASLIEAFRQFLDEGNPSAAIGLTSLAVLAVSRFALGPILDRIGLSARWSVSLVRLMPLVVLVGATVVVMHWNLDGAGVAVVGSVNAGLPGFHWLLPDLSMIQRLAMPALLMAIVGMVQNIAMAQALALKRGERVQANDELFGLGAANVVAAFYGGMPVGGGVSRSALNVAAGARSPLATIVAALTIAAIVSGTAASFSRMPLAALSAGIIVAASSMIDVHSLRSAWSYDRADALSWLGAAGGVVFFGLERGIELGIFLSLVALLVRASTPHIARLGRIPGSEHFRNTDRHTVETIPGTVFLRVDESLFFGNLQAIESRISREIAEGDGMHDLVLVMSAVNRVDTTAMEMLCDLNRDLLQRDIRLHLAEVKGPVQDRLSRSRLWPDLSGSVFISSNAAFEDLATGRHRERAKKP